MTKRVTINDVLNELEFTALQVEAFVSCLEAVKDEQINDTIQAEKEMAIIIEKVVSNENS